MIHTTQKTPCSTAMPPALLPVVALVIRQDEQGEILSLEAVDLATLAAYLDFQPQPLILSSSAPIPFSIGEKK